MCITASVAFSVRVYASDVQIFIKVCQNSSVLQRSWVFSGINVGNYSLAFFFFVGGVGGGICVSHVIVQLFLIFTRTELLNLHVLAHRITSYSNVAPGR